MTHFVQGFIHMAISSVAFPRFSLSSTTVPLAQGFELMIEPEYQRDPEVGPTSAIQKFGLECSTILPVAYINTEYTGGEGQQAAVAWQHGHAIEPFEWGDSVINRALRHLGVKRDPGCLDEYEAIGLGWYRDHGDWIAFAAKGRASWQRAAWPDAHEVWLEWRAAKT